MHPDTGCVIMATEVNFNDSEPLVVVFMTPFLGTAESA